MKSSYTCPFYRIDGCTKDVLAARRGCVGIAFVGSAASDVAPPLFESRKTIVREARRWRNLMTDHRAAKESRREDPRDPHRRQEPQRAEGRDAGKSPRKPSKIERREWRGAGVCGDRHTD